MKNLQGRAISGCVYVSGDSVCINQCSRGPTPARSRSAARLRRATLRRLARAAGADYCSRSPDPHAFFGLEIELIARLDTEGLIKSVEIHERSVGAILGRGVLLEEQRLAHVLLPGFPAPDLGPPQKQALFGREAVHRGSRFSIERRPIGADGDRKSTEVADVL